MAKTFKTSLQCGGCLATAKPFLDQALGTDQWSVDLEHQDKLLTVNNDEIQPDTVRAALEEAGFSAEPMA